jgi:2-keto-4-pentenoate hydratase/2-oxohepta-3-ene-1,7-dioic acid hydratase in catechol pathway
MRLATIQTSAGPRAALVHNGQYIDIHATDASLPATVRGVLEGGAATIKAVGALSARTGAVRHGAEVKLLAPIPDPGKIICIGLNYRDHAMETGAAIGP